MPCNFSDHFTKSRISIFNNNWANIHDFTPVEGETNWSSVTQNSALEELFKLPQSEEFKRYVWTELLYAVPKVIEINALIFSY